MPNTTTTSTTESGHYICTAHRPGAVTLSITTPFINPSTPSLIVAKSHHLQVYNFIPPSPPPAAISPAAPSPPPSSSSSLPPSLPLILDLPIRGRIATLLPIRHPSFETSLLFFSTDKHRYAVISYDPSSSSTTSDDDGNSGNVRSGNVLSTITHAKGSLRDSIGRECESGPLAVIDEGNKCLLLHLYDGFLKVLPVNKYYRYNSVSSKGRLTSPSHQTATPSILSEPFNVRIDERTILDLCFISPPSQQPGNTSNNNTAAAASEDDMEKKMPANSQFKDSKQQLTSNNNPQIAILHQDSRGIQHLISHSVDLRAKELLRHPGSSQNNTSTNNNNAPTSSQNNNNPLPSKLMKKQRVDGGSGKLLPHSSGVLILGSRQMTYHSVVEGCTKIVPLGGSSDAAGPVLLLSGCAMEEGRFVFGDDAGFVRLLQLNSEGMTMDVIGTTSVASTMSYLGSGFLYVGSQFGDCQLVELETGGGGEEMGTDDVEDEEDDTHVRLRVWEEYTNLGPILDFDVVATGHHNNHASPSSSSAGGGTTASSSPCQIVTCSGGTKDGSLRLIRNGIGIEEQAAVDFGGIKGLWNLRKSFSDDFDTYLVQSYFNETRVLGFGSNDDENGNDIEEDEDEDAGAMEEVILNGFDAGTGTLFAGNIFADGMDGMVQITSKEVRLISSSNLNMVDRWESFDRAITLGSGNEAGQLVVALRGGYVVYLEIEDGCIKEVARDLMEREVSCVNLQPLIDGFDDEIGGKEDAMDIDGDLGRRDDGNNSRRSHLLAVGLWDDFTVRLLHLSFPSNTTSSSLSPLTQLLKIEFTSDTQARSLMLCTLGYQHMLLIGLGDGNLISYSLDQPHTTTPTVYNRKKVSLGTQSISLSLFQNTNINTNNTTTTAHSNDNNDVVPTTCVFATGDRPTVIYAAGPSRYAHAGGPSRRATTCVKIGYANVNLSASHPHQQMIVTNVTPFRLQEQQRPTSNPAETPQAMITGCLCLSDESTLRIGIIDDIQKLHVQTFPLVGFMPRRIVHHNPGRCFAVGGIDTTGRMMMSTMDGIGGDVVNVVKCFDDVTFEEIDSFPLDPFEMILSLSSATLQSCHTHHPMSSSQSSNAAEGSIVGVSDARHRRANNSNNANNTKTVIVVGTAYAYPDEDEPTKGRIILLECDMAHRNEIVGRDGGGGCDDDDVMDDVNNNGDAATGGGTSTTTPETTSGNRAIRHLTECIVRGGVYSICPFQQQSLLVSVNSKTTVYRFKNDEGMMELYPEAGATHHGHILSLFLKSQNDSSLSSSSSSQLAIVGDLMRSISLLEYSSATKTLEEVARDYDANWTTAIEMLTDDVYIGAENWNNLFVLRRNTNPSASDELKCRLELQGECHLGEMVNKFMKGSLVMSSAAAAAKAAATTSGSGSGGDHNNITTTGNSNSTSSATPPPSSSTSPEAASSGNTMSSSSSPLIPIIIGSQTLFATVDGTIGVILGLSHPTYAFFHTLERAMASEIPGIGGLSHEEFRAFDAERKLRPCQGFIDGDLCEAFLDLRREQMEVVVRFMNEDGGWEVTNGSGGNGEMMEVGGGGVGRQQQQGNSGSMGDEERVLTVEEVLTRVEEMSRLH